MSQQIDAKLRELTLFADDEQVCIGSMIRVRGSATMDVYPNCWQIDVWYPGKDDVVKLKYSKVIKICGTNGTELNSAEPSSVIERTIDGERCISICIYDGDAFWRSVVSMSVPSGASAIQSMIALVQSCTASIDIMDTPQQVNGTCERRQTFFGRTADSLDTMCHSYGVRAYTRPDGLYIVSPNQGVIDAILTDDDLLELAEGSDDGIVTISTDMIGRRVGTRLRLDTQAHGGDYRIIAIAVDADNETGPWNYRITLADETKLCANGTENWEGCK